MKRSYIKHIISLLLFGSNGVIASHIGLNSSQIVLFRTLLGSLLLGILFCAGKQKLTLHKHKRDALYITISGIAMGTSWMFLYEGFAQIGVSISSLIYYCGPVIIIALSPLLFHEKLTLHKVCGFTAVLFGLFLMNGHTMNSSGNIWGLFCAGMSAVTYAVMVIANKKALHITGMENTLLQLVVSFLTVSVFVGLKSGLLFHIDANDWGWILILGLLNTGIGCYFYFSSITNLPVQTVAVLGYLEPLSAVTFSFLFLGETMLPLQIAGTVLIIGGALFVECIPAKKENL